MRTLHDMGGQRGAPSDFAPSDNDRGSLRCLCDGDETVLFGICTISSRPWNGLTCLSRTSLRSCFESMSAPSPAVDQWWSAKKHLLAESGIPDNHKQHLANYYATTVNRRPGSSSLRASLHFSLWGDDPLKMWLKNGWRRSVGCTSIVEIQLQITAASLAVAPAAYPRRVMTQKEGESAEWDIVCRGEWIGNGSRSPEGGQQLKWDCYLQELPISSSAFKRTSVQSRRTSIAKDPGQIFDELWEKSRDVRPLADGSIRADASGSVRLLSRLCEAMDINLRTTRFGKNWLKHSVVFCHFAVGMGGISRESLKKRWVIWYDSVRSLNMDTDVPPPVAATR